ncbi:MAG: STAS domain-containing protein [Kiritimatiellae bacterium]|nr:STAS domain-containing protein [Kiritimatiellia bacterium]
MSNPDQDQTADRLLVVIQGDTAFVRIEGRGSFKISTDMKQFGAAAIEQKCRRFVFDMRHCLGMDSTFMGVLAGLAFRLRQKLSGEMLMVNLSTRTRGLLATLGLDQLIRPFMAGSTPPDLEGVLGKEPFEAPGYPPPTEQERAKTVLEAHEDLVRAVPANLPKFKDVITFLREDLKKAGGGAAKD